MHDRDVKLEAGRLIAAGVPKAEVAKRLDVSRSQVFQWVADRDPFVVAASGDVMNEAMRAAAFGTPIDDLDGAAGHATGGSVEVGGVADGSYGSSVLGNDDRVAVAQEAGLDPRWANRLQGNTVEELRADARALAEELPDRSPVPGLGVRGAPVAAGPSMNDLIRMAAGRVVVSS